MSPKRRDVLAEWVAGREAERQQQRIADTERFLAIVAGLGWTFAKTMTRNPHEYIVSGRTADPAIFNLDRYARPEKFHRITQYYFRADGGRDKYWRMGDIINRDHLDGWSEAEVVYRLGHLVMPGDFVFGARTTLTTGS